MFENIPSQPQPQSQPQPVPHASQQPIPVQPVPSSAQNGFQPPLQQLPTAPSQSNSGMPDSAPSSDGKVYTMPEKFMPEKRAPKTPSGSTKKGLMIGGIIFAVVVIILAIVVYAFQISTKDTQTKTNQNTNTTNSNTAPTNAATNANNTNAANTNNTNTVTNGTGVTNTGVGNVNKNLNDNINSGLFPNTNNANTNAATNAANANAALPNRSAVVDAADQDKDGLTDEEEQKIYATKINQPDSDRDGYIDGNEVLNGYSPAEANEKLLAAGLVIPYENKTFAWTMNYPAQWIAEAINESNTEVFFTSDTMDGELVQVIVTDNPSGQTAAEWYAGLYNVEPSTLDAVTVNGIAGVTTPDGFTYYLADAQHIFTLNYNFGTKTEVHFRTTFEMMVKSFALTGVSNGDI